MDRSWGQALGLSPALAFTSCVTSRELLPLSERWLPGGPALDLRGQQEQPSDHMIGVIVTAITVG